MFKSKKVNKYKYFTGFYSPLKHLKASIQNNQGLQYLKYLTKHLNTK